MVIDPDTKVEYKSVEKFCKAKGINVNHIRNRMYSYGISFEDAYAAYKSHLKNGVYDRYIWDEELQVYHKTLKAFFLSHGVSPRGVVRCYTWHNRGYDIYQCLKLEQGYQNAKNTN